MPDTQSVGGAIGRMLGRRVTRDRVTVAAISAARTTLRTFARILHVLFLEVTGFVFLCFALIGYVAFRREHAAYLAGKVGPGKVIVAGCFLGMFLWFGISSLWKARRRR